jgi:hypothetical protein
MFLLQNHPDRSAGILVLVHQNTQLRIQNAVLQEQIQELALQLHQQRVFFDAQLANTPATLSAVNDTLKIELDKIKKQILYLNEENNCLKQKN